MSKEVMTGEKLKRLKGALGRIPEKPFEEGGFSKRVFVNLVWDKDLTDLKAGGGHTENVTGKDKPMIAQIARKSADMGRAPDKIDLFITSTTKNNKGSSRVVEFNRRIFYKDRDVRILLLSKAQNLAPRFADKSFLGIGRILNNESVK